VRRFAYIHYIAFSAKLNAICIVKPPNMMLANLQMKRLLRSAQYRHLQRLKATVRFPSLSLKQLLKEL
jgi:hypothetical protein